MKWVSLIVGSCAGGVARYALSGIIHRLGGATFPYGTLVVNVSGCFLIGFLAALSEEKFSLGPNARLLLMVGFCGAFTTFSAFMLETANLIKGGESLHALTNVVVSVAIGFLVFKLGVMLAELV
jgi:fluoride exporter